MMASFFKSAKNKVKSKFQGHSSKDDSHIRRGGDGGGIGRQGAAVAAPGSPLRAFFYPAAGGAAAVADRKAFSEANINMADFRSAEEFNLAAMRLQRESEEKSGAPLSYTDKTHVHSPGATMAMEVSSDAETAPPRDESVMGKYVLSLDTIQSALDKSCFNVAVLGRDGCGKSSLINALSGLRDNEPGAAPVREMKQVAIHPQFIFRMPNRRYPDFIFYDIPGADRFDTEASALELVPKLKPFDCILLVSAERFLDMELTLAREFTVDATTECLLVRTQADVAATALSEASSIPMKEAGDQLRELVEAEIRSRFTRSSDDAALPTVYIMSSRFHAKAVRTYQRAISQRGRFDKTLEKMDEDAVQSRLEEVYDAFQRRKVAARVTRAKATPQGSRQGQGADSGLVHQPRNVPPVRPLPTQGRWQPDPGVQEVPQKLTTISEISSGKEQASQTRALPFHSGQNSSSTVIVKMGSEVKMPINKTVKSISVSVSQEAATLQVIYA